MSSTRTARVLLEYEVNQASTRKAEESAKQVQRGLKNLDQTTRDIANANRLSARTMFEMEKGFEATRKSIASTEQVAERMNKQLFDLARQKAVDTIAVDFQAMEQQTKNTAASLEMVAKRLREIGATDNEIDRVINRIADMDNAGTGGANSLGRRVSRFGQAIFNAPAVGPSTPIARGIYALGGVIEATDSGLGKVALSMGLVAPAAVLAAIAIDRFSKSIQDQKKVLDGALAGQNAYYSALGQLTSTEVRERIGELTNSTRIRGQQIAETQASMDAAFAATAEAIGDLGARALDNQTPVAQLREQLEELQAQQQIEEQTIGRLTQGYNANAFAANDAAAAEARLREERKLLVESAFAGIRTEIEAQNMSAEQRQERIAQIQVELQLLRQTQIANSNNSEVATALALRYTQLYQEGQRLASITETVVDREAKLSSARQLISDQTTKLFDIEAQRVRAIEDVQKAQALAAAADREAAAKLKALDDERLKKRAEAEAKAADELAEKLREAEEKRTEIVEQAGKDRVRIEKTFADARSKAIADRDAVALLDARKKRKEELYELDVKLKEQLATVDKAYDKQKKAVEKSLQEQLRTIETNASESIRKERERALREQQIRQDAINLQIFQQQQLENQLAVQRAGRYAAERALYGDMFTNAQFWLSQIGMLFATMGTTGGGGKSGGGIAKGNNYSASVGGVTVNAGPTAREVANIAGAAARAETYRAMREALQRADIIRGR